MCLVTEVAVAQERAYRIVVVRQFMKTVEVATQPLLQDPKHQDLPQVHSRTPDRAVGLRKNMFVQQRKQPLAQLLVTPDVLKSLQHRRDVVTRLRVDRDLVDGHLTELDLRPVNFSHDVNVAKIVPKWVDPREITCKNTASGRASPLQISGTPCGINDLQVFFRTLLMWCVPPRNTTCADRKPHSTTLGARAPPKNRRKAHVYGHSLRWDLWSDPSDSRPDLNYTYGYTSPSL